MALIPARLTSLATPPDPAAVESWCRAWAEALSHRDPGRVTDFYADDAVVHATFNDHLGTRDDVWEYFSRLLRHDGFHVVIEGLRARGLSRRSATISGFYTYVYEEHGERIEVPARFTLVFARRGERWLIVEHHSSVRPGTTMPRAIFGR